MNLNAVLFVAGSLGDSPDPDHAPDLYGSVNSFLDLIEDDDACLARAAVLRRLGALGNAMGFFVEFSILASGDVAEALSTGKLRPNRLAELARDPDALLLAHRAWVHGEMPSMPETRKGTGGLTSPTSRESVSRLARAGEMSRVADRLRVCLPELRDLCGFTDEQVARLSDELDALPAPDWDGEFWKGLAGWVNAFARRVGADPAAPEDTAGWRDLLHRAAARTELEDAHPGEPEANRAFRQLALAARPGSPQDIQAVPDGPSPVSASFRQKLVQLATLRHKTLLAEFEV